MTRASRPLLVLSLVVASQAACSAPPPSHAVEADAAPPALPPSPDPAPPPAPAPDAGADGAPATPPPTTELAIATPHSAPTGLTRGPDGNLWFTEAASPGKIGRMTEAGVLTEFALPTPNSAPNVIVAGSDGNLWFTEHNANQIGRITTDGAVTEFPIPTASSGPTGIAAGPDGNLWFTEFAAGQIGRITPAGVVTEMAIPTPNAGPFRITSATDGNLWFSEKLSSAVGRVTPAGVFTELATPTPGAGPLGIAPNPSGGVVVCEHDVNVVATVTAAGVFTEYAIPTAGAFPQEAMTADDGSLWFTEANVSRLGELTASGAFREVEVPSPYGGVGALVSGSGGTVWFLESEANKIGRFDPAIARAIERTHPSRVTSAAKPPPSAPAPRWPTPEIVGGRPINSPGEAVTAQFPFSTVHITYTSSDGTLTICTGVILSSTQVMTAAHCQFPLGTFVEYYNNKRTDPTTYVSTIASLPTLPPNVTGTPSVFTGFTGDGFTNSSGDYADIAIIALATPIDHTKYPFVPITLLPGGTYSNDWMNSSWIVGTGFMNGVVNLVGNMQYVASILKSNNDNTGYFVSKETYVDNGDSGGPVYQEAIDGSLRLIGITSGVYVGDGGDRFTSVSRTSNYNWIQGMIVYSPP